MTVPHHFEKTSPGDQPNTLELTPFDHSQFAYQIVDPRVQVVAKFAPGCGPLLESK